MPRLYPPLASLLLLMVGVGLSGERLSAGAARPAAAVARALPPVHVWSFEAGSLCDDRGRGCAAPLGGAVADGVAILSSPGDALRVPERTAPRLRGPLTVSAWVAPGQAAPAAARQIVAQAGAGGYDLGLDGDRYRFTVLLGGAALSVSAPGTTDAWTHVAGVFDGRAARLYLDGRLVASADAPAGAERLFSGGPLLIGAQRAWSAAPWLLDDVRIYAADLSPAQVARLAGGGDGCVARAPGGGAPAC